jgi:phosphoglucosamine mutase
MRIKRPKREKLKKAMQKYPQNMLNVPIGTDFNLKKFPLIQKAIDEAAKELKDRGRILLRPSGTEPLVRVMVEAEDSELVNKIVRRVADIVEKEVGVTSR